MYKIHNSEFAQNVINYHYTKLFQQIHNNAFQAVQLVHILFYNKIIKLIILIFFKKYKFID